ncbi:MFS general substrate transporter [Auriculariales sp. MPI-PUGE-AT-0066]|nr:MFS general substrate transporter [Auriculariales sp. MPI-PUGE-AT-0066]
MSKIDAEKQVGEHPALHHGSSSEALQGEPPKFGYRHPIVQIIIVSIICFTCPGMFNALSGLGGGGQIDTKTNSDGATALYSTFAVMAFFGGTFVNKLGPRIALAIGTTGYTLYIGSFLYYNIHHKGGFTIAAGAILGICAGLLWTAQGVLMLAYSTEATKGRYIAVFWAIFNLGAVIGAIVPLSQQINQVADTSVKNQTYIAFVIITAVGGACSFLLANPTTVRRADGTIAAVPVSQSWLTEILNVFTVLISEPSIFFLFPFFAASNFFYTWQFSFLNLVIFNPRTRSLNNLLYWSSQIIGSRKAGWAFLTVLIIAIWGGNYKYQKGLTRANTCEECNHHKMDWTEKGYGAGCVLYIFNGLSDAAWQTYSYWIIGAMSNNARKIAVLVGIYKGLQSACAAVGWAIDSHKVEYVNMYGGTFGFLMLGLLVAAPMIFTRVQEHTNAADDQLGGIDATGHVAGEHVMSDRDSSVKA